MDALRDGLPLPDPGRAVSSRATRQSRLWRSVALLALVGVSLTVGWLGGAIVDAGTAAWKLSTVERLLFVLALVPMLGIAVLLHECGHLLGGWLGGFRFAWLIIGPLKVYRDGDRLRWRRNRDPRFYGGAIACTHGATDHLRKQMLGYVAGGPLASLTFGAAMLAAYFAFGMNSVAPETQGSVTHLAGAALFTLGISSLLLGLATLLPTHLWGLRSDGAQLLRLLGSRGGAERDAAVAALEHLSFAGQRPRDWDAALLERALGSAGRGAPGFEASLLAYHHALDRARPHEAGMHLLQASQHVTRTTATQRAELAQEGAYFEAAYRNDPAAARRWLEWAARESVAEVRHPHRALAAIRIAEGDLDRAAEELERARDGLRRSIDTGRSRALLDALDALERRGHRGAAAAAEGR